MPESADSAKEDYFNDLSQPLEDAERSVGANEGQPKTKRIACILCRKRKLRCDGCRPTCGTCKRLSHDCTYDEVRKKSGPKRGYVKLLEARLQQVETLLKSQEPESSSVLATARAPVENAFASRPVENTFSPTVPTDMGMGREALSQQDFVLLDAPAETVAEDPFSWEVVGMGLEESLPPQDTINELNEVYFQKIHPAIPMIHRGRFLASMSLAPHMRPPISLRYAVWCHAASLTDRYESLTDTFYQRARKYLHNDEMKRHGESLLNVGYCQAWLLVSMHEFRNMYFPRAWMSVGRSVRLAQMLGLQRLDGVGLDVKQCLQPAKDWIEAEERRRTFWIAFCQDRYASVGTGWPMTIDETDIMTNLPAPDASFESGTPVPLISLEQALKPTGAAQLHSTSGVIIMAVLLGRNLLHLHRPSKANDDHDLNGEFWQRHRDLEGILAHTALSMPDSMRLPAGLPNPSTIFTNMLMHTSAICLHQAAIFKADKHRLPANVASESRVRCVTAAAEIARIMRMISHLDLGNMHPFMTFSLYVANRVFIQYLKFRPNDGQMMSSLQFLLAAMNALKRRNPLSESFIAQLDVDLEVSGFGESVRYMTKTSLPLDPSKCSPLVNIRDTTDAPTPTATSPHGFPTPPTDSPGPPFHTARANINLDIDPSSLAYLADPYALPSRGKSAGPPNLYRAGSSGARVVPLSDSNSPMSDADRSPNMGSASSRSGTSQSASFTPPSEDAGSFNTTGFVGYNSQTTGRASLSSVGEGSYGVSEAEFSTFVTTQGGAFGAPVLGAAAQTQVFDANWQMGGEGMEQNWSAMLDAMPDWSAAGVMMEGFENANSKPS